jgi:hypothetical protein
MELPSTDPYCICLKNKMISLRGGAIHKRNLEHWQKTGVGSAEMTRTLVKSCINHLGR